MGVLPLSAGIGHASGNTLKIVMAALMSLAVIVLSTSAVATAISDARAREDEGAL